MMASLAAPPASSECPFSVASTVRNLMSLPSRLEKWGCWFPG